MTVSLLLPLTRLPFIYVRMYDLSCLGAQLSYAQSQSQSLFVRLQLGANAHCRSRRRRVSDSFVS